MTGNHTLSEARSAPPRSTAQDDVIDLAEYVRALWGARWLVFLSAILLASTTAGVIVSRPRVYETATTLLVSQPKLGEAPEVLPANVARNFRVLLENRAILSEVHQAYGLAGPPASLTFTEFVNTAFLVDVVPDTFVLRASVRLPDPKLSADVANAVASRVVLLAERVGREEASRARVAIENQRNESLARLKEAETTLEEFRKRAQIEVLRKDVATMLDQRGQLHNLTVQAEAERARAATSDAELSHRRRTGTLTESIVRSPGLMEVARAAPSQTGPEGLLGLQLKSEFIDRVYDGVDLAGAETKVRLAGIDKQVAELERVRQVGGATLPRLQQLVEREAEMDRLQTRLELAKRVYTEIATRFEMARVQEANRTAQLQIVDPALVPERPVGRSLVRNTALAFVGGAIAAAALVLLRTALRPAIDGPT